MKFISAAPSARCRTLPVFVLWLFALMLAVAAGPARAQTLESLLAYDPALPLQVQVLHREHRRGAWIEDIRFRGADGVRPVLATVVRPTQVNGPYAGIVWGHWYEPAASNSNRSQFVDEAAALARRGVVSVMPDTLWSDLDWFFVRSWRDDFSSTVEQARDFRRTIDVLLAQSGVDPARVAFVGHDFSGMHAALISAVESRVKAYVIIGAVARWSDWFLFGAADGVPQGAELDAYLSQLAVIDPIRTIALQSAPVMFQFGEDDFFTPRDNFIAFYAAGAPKTTRITSYETDHPLDLPIVRHDRDHWLAEQLGLDGAAPPHRHQRSGRLQRGKPRR